MILQLVNDNTGNMAYSCAVFLSCIILVQRRRNNVDAVVKSYRILVSMYPTVDIFIVSTFINTNI